MGAMKTGRVAKRIIDTASAAVFRRAAWPLLRLAPPERASVPGKCTVILLNWRRPFNIELQLQIALACDFVGEVILSNNNPECDLDRYVRSADPRIRRIDHPVRRYASVRFEVARAARHSYVLAVDDDVFPRPAQLRRLFEALVGDPQRPHGFGGQIYPESFPADRGSGAKRRKRLVYREEREVDSLVWAFAFTREVNERYFDLLGRIGETNDTITTSEDVPLSFAGHAPALVHDFGRIVHCPSSHDDDVATYRQAGFAERRKSLVVSCRDATGLRVAREPS